MYGYQGGYGGYNNQPQYQSTNAAATASLYQQHQQQQAAAAAAAASIYGNSSTATAATNPYQSYPYSAATTTTQQHPYSGYATGTPAAHQFYGSTGGLKNAGAVGANAAAQSASYSPYDAAVYAATNSYIANKKNAAQSSANANPYAWMNSGNNKPHWANKKKFGSGGGDSTIHYCEVCKISCAGTITYKEHLEGKQHKRKEAMQKGEQTVALARNKVSYRCDLCNVTCAGQDTYMSHIRGKQHTKAIALCKKMGKPVPEDVPTILTKGSQGEVQETKAKSKWHQQQLPGTNKIVGINTINFVEGAKLNTTGRLEEKKKEVMAAVSSVGSSVPIKQAHIEVDDARVQALIEAESIKPIGEEHVEAERDATGKLINYVCTICDCKFSDPNAKDVHLKGRRHRLAYQKKVDPNFRVYLKPSSRKAKEIINNAIRKRPNIPPGPYFGPVNAEMHRFNVLNDRHLKDKHMSLIPRPEYLRQLENFVSETESILKLVGEDMENNRIIFDQSATKAPQSKNETEPRVLLGHMRVGAYGRSIFLKSDDLIEIVVCFTPVPTKELVQYVRQSFTTHTKTMTIDSDPISAACLIVKHSDLENVRIRILLTSPTLQGEDADADCIDRETCLMALKYIKRSKWFANCCLGPNACQQVLRIFRDMRKRSQSWAYLDDHSCDLLVQRVLSSYPCTLSPTDAFKAVIEAISTGIICTGILYDPCEKEKVNVFDVMNEDQKHELTSAAQTALRLIAFNQIYEVLEMDRLSDIRPSLAKKRQNEDRNGESTESKKDKLEENDGEQENENTNTDNA